VAPEVPEETLPPALTAVFSTNLCVPGCNLLTSMVTNDKEAGPSQGTSCATVCPVPKLEPSWEIPGWEHCPGAAALDPAAHITWA